MDAKTQIGKVPTRRGAGTQTMDRPVFLSDLDPEWQEKLKRVALLEDALEAADELRGEVSYAGSYPDSKDWASIQEARDDYREARALTEATKEETE